MMPRMVERTLIDTNILVYALYQQSEYHQASRAVLNSAEAADAGLCLVPQSLSEFYAVVTHPRRVTPAQDPFSALAAIEAMIALPGIALLQTPADIGFQWMELIRQRPVLAHHIFDVQLIAAMLGNGVRRIITFNTDDFLPY